MLLLARQRDPRQAEVVATRALEKYPLNASLWLVLALAEYAQGDRAAALRAAERSHQINPTRQTAYVYGRLSEGLPLAAEGLTGARPSP